MIKPFTKKQMQRPVDNSASTRTGLSNSEQEDSAIRLTQHARNDSDQSISMRIASKLKQRIPALAIKEPSSARLTSGLRQTLRSASGTLQKLNHPGAVPHASERQIVQEVLDHRRLSRKKN